MCIFTNGGVWRCFAVGGKRSVVLENKTILNCWLEAQFWILCQNNTGRVTLKALGNPACYRVRVNWLMRDITIFGRNLLSKAEGISKLVYPCHSLYVPPRTIKKVNSIIYNFIWRNKTHYVKKSQLVKESNKGGLKTFDFEAMVGVFKINWIKASLSQPESLWSRISRNIFRKVWGLNFLLKCDFEITKVPLKLSVFHRQVLYYWKLIFFHNFTPHCSTLWNNRVITISSFQEKLVWQRHCICYWFKGW